MGRGGLCGGLATAGAGLRVFLDAVHRDGDLDRPAPRLDVTPAFRPADEAFLLLVPRLGGRVLQTIDLVERLTSLRIGVYEPAHAIMGAASAVAPPVNTLFWMLAQGKFKENAPLKNRVTRLRCAPPSFAAGEYADSTDGWTGARTVAYGIIFP